MTASELALEFIRRFGNGEIDRLGEIVADELIFRGPYLQTDTKSDYLDALRSDPPESGTIRVLSVRDAGEEAAVSYEYVKTEGTIVLDQWFRVHRGVICETRLTFDPDHSGAGGDATLSPEKIDSPSTNRSADAMPGKPDTGFTNVYEDARRAEAYSGLEFPGTYWLAFRDLPALIASSVTGRGALDFGCGAGRSTRFLQTLGFQVIGVDVSAQMIERARRRDPSSDYRLIDAGGLSQFPDGEFDLILAAFTFDNIPAPGDRLSYFSHFERLLARGGRVVNLVSSPEIYLNEWASFTTRDFPENRTAQNGDAVLIRMLDVEDSRPVEDVLWNEQAYREVYREAGLAVLEIHRPLGRADEPFDWVSETTTAPWTIYLLHRVDDP